MLKYKLIGVALYLKALLGKFDFEAARLNVVQDKKFYTIEKAGEINIQEISGLTLWRDTLYAITDSGGEAVIYKLDKNISFMDSIHIDGTSNIDWETLANDTSGNFYIGDVGNNMHRRQNLRIYKFGYDSLDTIKISYLHQQDFPPRKKKRNYDCEAMFWTENALHLFSKNWGRKCVKHYMLPDHKGEPDLEPIEEVKLNSMITGAAINPAGDIVVLSGYGKLYFFRKDGVKIFENPVMLIETTRLGQNEAIVFLDESTLLLCNENGEFFKVRFLLPKEK